jgi:DNA-binding response OmpR family regulator
MKNKKILIVDTDKEYIKFLWNLLRPAGYEISVALDGQQGIRKFKAESPDLVISELLLPKLNGFEFCNQIFRMDKKNTPILILTGARKRMNFPEGAIETHPPAPISGDKDPAHELLNIIHNSLSEKKEGLEVDGAAKQEKMFRVFQKFSNDLKPREEKEAKPHAPLESKADPVPEAGPESPPEAMEDVYKIILGNSNPILKKIVRSAFPEDYFQVYTISKPEKCHINLERIKPDLIILELNEPEVTGYQLYEKIKEHKEFSQIPMIILKGTYEATDFIRTEEFTHDELMQKPFDSSKLVTEVKKVLNQKTTKKDG